MFVWIAVLVDVADYALNQRMHIHLALVEGDDSFFGAIESEAFALGSWTHLGNVVEAKHHVLRRDGDGVATGRRQDIV